jgi:hypothetical protein
MPAAEFRAGGTSVQATLIEFENEMENEMEMGDGD